MTQTCGTAPAGEKTQGQCNDDAESDGRSGLEAVKQANVLTNHKTQLMSYLMTVPVKTQLEPLNNN